MLLRIQVFWNVTLCCLPRLLDPEWRHYGSSKCQETVIPQDRVTSKDFNLKHWTFLFWRHYLNVKSAHVPSANASSASPYTVKMQLQLLLFQIVTNTITCVNDMLNDYVKIEKLLDLFVTSTKKWSEVGEINRMSANSLSNQWIGQTHITLRSLLKPMKLWKMSHLSLVYVSTAM